MNFSKRLDLFGDEIFAALNERRLELEKQGKKIYNMSVGTPDFHTPDHIKKALMRRFRSIENIRDASVEELSQTESMNVQSAEAVYQFFHTSSDQES